ncbi:hypothetical protein RIR_jg18829.t1 [Rhizophagus irregularis DAOM 181602=DAOM 197198]|nr:hypothetical protein RIR_jg18829.t1 [Rhizophagus irregularis DAOM 181602=DAOM 197198]
MVKIYLDINFHEERILSTLVKLFSMSKSTWILIFTKSQVKIYLDINFYEERILSTLAKQVFFNHKNIYKIKINGK